jgi:transposase
MAKSYLDAAVGNEKRRFSNERIGHRELIKWVKQIKAPGQVICESSGGYERAFVQRLARARVKISLVQANRVRQFARAAGILAKTDRIDAELLCSFGKVMRPLILSKRHVWDKGLVSIRRHVALGLEQRNICERAAESYPNAYACWSSRPGPSQSRKWRVCGSANHTRLESCIGGWRTDW